MGNYDITTTERIDVDGDYNGGAQNEIINNFIRKHSMHSYGSPEGYLYNLHTCSPAEAKRMWKESIKTQWDNKCAYCGSDKNITLDHIVPQCKGGSDHMSNVLSCCLSCNADKAHEDWIIWFIQQPFFTEERRQRIEDWMSVEEEVNPLIYHARDRALHAYKPRKNKSY